jgi:hypothetical protein
VVLGNKIIKLAASIAVIIIGVGMFVSVFDISIAGDQVVDETIIAGYKLTIVEHDGKCELVFQGEKGTGKLPLGSKPPCRFLTERGGKVQSYSYSDVKVKAILLVIGTQTKPEEQIPATRNKNYYCGDVNRGVIIRYDGVFVTKLTDRGYNMCTNLGAEEKIFWLFAHEKELIGPGNNDKKK